METKLKICHRCEKPKRLWRSNPPTCRECDGIIQAMAKQSAPSKAAGKPKPASKELNIFFADQAAQVPERCENCHGLLKAFTPSAKRFVTAHILPKNERAFPSVATHPQNKMFLGCSLFSDCNCHGDWDYSDAETRKQMPVYKIALQRVECFIEQLNPRDQVKAEKYLGL